MPIPDEAAIREYAESIGAINDKGRYMAPRPVLAAGALRAAEDAARTAEIEEAQTEIVDRPTTAELLAHFKRELVANNLSHGYAVAILGHVAQALVEREGLHLQEEEEPAK